MNRNRTNAKAACHVDVRGAVLAALLIAGAMVLAMTKAARADAASADRGMPTVQCEAAGPLTAGMAACGGDVLGLLLRTPATETGMPLGGIA